MLKTEQIGSLNVVVIKIREEIYLLEVRDVKEIFIPKDKIVPIPLVQRDIVGVIDIRGDVYTIISLRHKIFEDEKTYNITEDSRILLLEIDDLHLALLVDMVLGVQKIPVSIFKTSKMIVETQIDYQYIKSIGVMDGETYILLDLETLIPPVLESMIRTPYVARKSAPKSKTVEKISRRWDREETVHVPTIPALSKTSGRSSVKPLSLSGDARNGVNLTDDQRDMLMEIGNIGSGNAITALSRLIKKKINVELTDVGITSFTAIVDQFGGREKEVCGIFCHMKGTSESTILQVFDKEPLLRLVAGLAGKDTKIDPAKVKNMADLDDFAISTIKEVGNIMAGHYTSALADLTGTKMMIDIPEFTMSGAGELDDFLMNELSNVSDIIILIKTKITIEDMNLSGVFFFVPDVKTVEFLFDRLGIEYEASIPSITFEGLANTIRKVDVNNIALNQVQRDALQEVGNIGAGNAANALAKMLGKRVDINIPAVEMTALDYFANTLTKDKKPYYVSWSNVKGKTNATVISLFHVEDMIDLISILIDDADKKQIDMRRKYDNVDSLPDVYKDAMNEVGHILASNYASSIGDLLEMRLMTEVPEMMIEKGASFLKVLTKKIGLVKELTIVITTNIIVTDYELTGTFLYIPDLNTIQELLDGLSMFFE